MVDFSIFDATVYLRHLCADKNGRFVAKKKVFVLTTNVRLPTSTLRQSYLSAKTQACVPLLVFIQSVAGGLSAATTTLRARYSAAEIDAMAAGGEAFDFDITRGLFDAKMVLLTSRTLYVDLDYSKIGASRTSKNTTSGEPFTCTIYCLPMCPDMKNTDKCKLIEEYSIYANLGDLPSMLPNAEVIVELAKTQGEKSGLSLCYVNDADRITRSLVFPPPKVLFAASSVGLLRVLDADDVPLDGGINAVALQVAAKVAAPTMSAAQLRNLGQGHSVNVSSSDAAVRYFQHKAQIKKAIVSVLPTILAPIFTRLVIT